MENEKDVIFNVNTVEFVTVAREFCTFLENAVQRKRSDFVDTALKILPLLYMKASMIPPCEVLREELLENFVTEDTYEVIRLNLATLMGEVDDYLVITENGMVYNDMPVRRCISEDLTDIYQSVKDFVCLFRLGFHETMHDALAACKEEFEDNWGVVLVNAMRALHGVRYEYDNMDEMEGEEYE